jgi:AcrR family transcriptional regulator
MARRKVEARREEILATTVAQVQLLGFANTRVADVATALGISPGLVFYHFTSKDRLLAAALEYAVDSDLARLELALGRGQDAFDRLERLLRFYAPQGKAPGWTLWIDAWASALREPALRRTMRRLDVRWRDALHGVIVDGVAERAFSCADPYASAQRITALLDGLGVQVTLGGNVSRRQMAAWVREAAAAELGTDPGRLARAGQ